MDFSDRKCCEDGLGPKTSVSYYQKMAVQLILNLSVFNFSLFRTGEKDPRVAGRDRSADGQTGRQADRLRWTDRQTYRQTKRLKIRISPMMYMD